MQLRLFVGIGEVLVPVLVRDVKSTHASSRLSEEGNSSPVRQAGDDRCDLSVLTLESDYDGVDRVDGIEYLISNSKTFFKNVRTSFLKYFTGLHTRHGPSPNEVPGGYPAISSAMFQKNSSGTSYSNFT